MGYGAPIYIDAHNSKYIVNLMKTKSEMDTMLGAARFETYYMAAGNDMKKVHFIAHEPNIGLS